MLRLPTVQIKNNSCVSPRPPSDYSVDKNSQKTFSSKPPWPLAGPVLNVILALRARKEELKGQVGGKGEGVKEILFKKRINKESRTKSLSLGHTTEDRDCVTRVQKDFVYSVEPSEETSPSAEIPQIYITKALNRKQRSEKFNFQVKGSFYVNHNRWPVKINFQHTLNIEILWKEKHFSPKKSEVLT